MKNLLIVVFLAFAGTISYAQPKIGSSVPEIVITDDKGQVQMLSALKGKVVLVDFWASWCMPCRQSNRALVPIYSKYAGKGFEVFGVSLDNDTLAWKKAIRTDKIKWVQLNEKGGWNTPTSTAWGIELLPTSFLLDKQGVVISIDPSPAELRKYLEQALK